MSKSDKSKKRKKIDVEAINKNAHKLDEKMAKVRREFLIKQARSHKSAREFVITS